jgi:hypothetical integral membrane protein (TIGR02206 family)
MHFFYDFILFLAYNLSKEGMMFVFLFDTKYETFKMFGFSHILAILFFIGFVVVMSIYRNKLGKNFKFFMHRIVPIMMIILEITFFIWRVDLYGFDTDFLPLGVCTISMIVTSIALLIDSEKLIKFIFPWATAGALISLVIANQTYEFPHFRYVHYFFNHGFFLMGNLYYLIVRRVKMTYLDFWKSGGPLLIYTAIIYPINFLLDDNHLFLRHVPEEAQSFYGFLGDFWVVGFVISIVALIHIIYFITRFSYRYIKPAL